jgi:hypothetical protein
MEYPVQYCISTKCPNASERISKTSEQRKKHLGVDLHFNVIFEEL